MTSLIDKKTTAFDLTYFRRRQQNHVHDAVLSRFAELSRSTGLTRKALAEYLGKNPAQITRWLSGSSNLTLDTISDLLLAMGAEMRYQVVDIKDSKPCEIEPFIPPTATSAGSANVQADISFTTVANSGS